MMTVTEFCDRHRACRDGREWALANCRDMQEAWDKAKPELVVWIATRPGVLDDSTLMLFSDWLRERVIALMTYPRSQPWLDRNFHPKTAGKTGDDLCNELWKSALTARDVAAYHAAWFETPNNEWSIQAAWLRENAKPNFDFPA